MNAPSTAVEPRWRFDRHELAGSFGDIGTDLPLLIALVATCGVDPASAFGMFGALQIGTGLLYGIPMPVQPLKGMASIMIAQRLDPGTMTGGGLAIGVIMLVLTLTGLLNSIVSWVPKQVVRGIQLGLGTSLAGLALGMVSKEGGTGYVLAGACVAALLTLRRQRRFPAPLLIMGFGALYALFAQGHAMAPSSLVGLRFPSVGAPSLEQVRRGVLLLALPQLPLSIGNSVIATSQTTADLFPRRAVSVKKIGFTYGIMNLIAPWFGGVPVCHGCGGLVGFHGFGARTGGAPIIYGALYLVIGLAFSPGFSQVVHFFPMPLLGVVLLFEAVGLMTLVRDIAADSSALWVAFAVAAAVVGLPYGYAVGLVLGTVIARGAKRGWLSTPTAPGQQIL